MISETLRSPVPDAAVNQAVTRRRRSAGQGQPAAPALERSVSVLGSRDSSQDRTAAAGVGLTTKPKRAPYPDLKGPCLLWFSASASKPERDKIFTDHIFPTFQRLASFHFTNAIKPKYIDGDAIVADVVSHLFEALRCFDPDKTSNPWYYFNLCARNQTWRAIQESHRSVSGTRDFDTFNAQYVSDTLQWDQYIPADSSMIDDQDGMDSTLVQALLDHDEELTLAIIGCDDDDFSNQQLRPHAKQRLSDSLGDDFNKRLLQVRKDFYAETIPIVSASAA